MLALALTLSSSSFLGGAPPLGACRRTGVGPVRMSLSAADWQILRSRETGGIILGAADPGTEARVVTATVPRNADSPSLGLLLEEVASTDTIGIIAVGGLVEGGNGEQASAPILAGDALVAAAEVGGSGAAVSLEGLTYDGVLEALSSLDASVGVKLELKRLVRMPRATVTLVFPEAEDRPEETMVLYKGSNLRRSMLSSGIKLNDPMARRFDAGVGTGDCGGEGTCCTCAVEVAKGLDVLSEQGTQEKQIMRRFPRWRLACKATIGSLTEDVDVTLRVMPRNFNGFYGEDEVDVDGELLARDAKR